jgi:hypothetical protein
MLSSCLEKVVDSVKSLKSDPLKYTLLMGIIFNFSVVSTHVIFDDIYITAFIAAGILFLGYMGYATYRSDQERKVLEKINGNLQAMAGEIAMAKARSRKKNGRL